MQKSRLLPQVPYTVSKLLKYVVFNISKRLKNLTTSKGMLIGPAVKLSSLYTCTNAVVSGIKFSWIPVLFEISHVS
jgi:hypothetical protein